MSENKPRVLLVTEKWCDLKPEMGLSNTLYNVHNTLMVSDTCWVTQLFYDEIATWGNVDTELRKVWANCRPNAVIVMPCFGASCNPSFEVIKQFSRFSRIVYIWPDAIAPTVAHQINEYGSFIDLNVIWDTPNVQTRYNHKCIFTPVPQDPALYHNVIFKPIKVSMMGSLKQPGRQEIADYLDNNLGHDFVCAGGQREHPISAQDYAMCIRNSLISINTCWSVAGDQMKGRVSEILHCNTMLLESANSITSQVFTPGVDYVEFTSKEDCLNKIVYYLEHEDERAKIADAGFKKIYERYNARAYWTKIIGLLNLSDSPLNPASLLT